MNEAEQPTMHRRKIDYARGKNDSQQRFTQKNANKYADQQKQRILKKNLFSLTLCRRHDCRLLFLLQIPKGAELLFEFLGERLFLVLNLSVLLACVQIGGYGLLHFFRRVHVLPCF